jgi:hypothetical protein
MLENGWGIVTPPKNPKITKHLLYAPRLALCELALEFQALLSMQQEITTLVSCAKWNSFMLFFALSSDCPALNPPFKVSKEMHIWLQYLWPCSFLSLFCSRLSMKTIFLFPLFFFSPTSFNHVNL